MNNLEKEFVPYTEALELKQLGFDERTLQAYYKDSGQLLNIGSGNMYDTKAPLYQQAFRWFREKYGLCSWITMELGNKPTFCWVLSGEHASTQYAAYFHTYEEAELACLRKLIEIVKQKQQ
jgi:hypothetical protein